MTQALVTGGSGFIGQHLVTALLRRGRRVRILDLQPPAAAAGDAHFIQGSVLDRARVRQALEGVDTVYHLAALPGMWMPHKSDFHTVNCGGTEIVIDAARTAGVSRLLHCSTESILFGRRPTTASVLDERTETTPDEMPGAYTRSKLLAEQCALSAAASGLPVVIANPTMPIGPHNGKLTPPTLMLRHFVNQRVQAYFDFVLNLVDVRDVATGLMLAMERGQSGHRYILGGEDVSLGDLLERLGAITGRKSLRVHIPSGFARMTALTLETLADHVTRRPPAATMEGVRIALRAKAISIDKARRELGYAPRPIERALREAIGSVPAEALSASVAAEAPIRPVPAEVQEAQ